MTRSTKTTNKIDINYEIVSLPGSPLTESNRRPSPYHRSPRSPVAAGRAGDQAEHEHRPAHVSPRQALASAICHSICHSLRSCSLRFAAAHRPLKGRSGPASSRSPSQARGISSNRLCGGERKPADGAATSPAVPLSRKGTARAVASDPRSRQIQALSGAWCHLGLRCCPSPATRLLAVLIDPMDRVGEIVWPIDGRAR